ncbi:uncharacterized protein G2W53_017221 [Senna tora]|uniref:DUF4378 domain-containing protein n=1 Tax=Senna tora TaxID=362788 RepID=A0A834WKA1_9FABA|nr:uncharacterized protein G2W53_017221 [Senna tora]
MAKRSPRRAQRYEKDHSGCMWGFISMFDFRHGRPTQKLITDKRHSSKHAVGAVHSKNKFEMSSNLEEDCQNNIDSVDSKRTTVTTDADKPSVKKLIEEEMFVDQNPINNIDNSEVESKGSRLRFAVSPLKIDSKRKKKSRAKSCDMDTLSLKSDATFESELSYNQHSRLQSKGSLDLDKIMEDFCHLKDACSVMRDRDGEVHAQSNEKNDIAENKARQAINEFVNQIMFNEKDQPEDGKFPCSQELMEALQVISSDKELFLRLLQDPNSHLLKHVQELGNAQGTNHKEYCSITDFNMSEQEPGNLRQATEIVSRKHRNIFGKKVKSQAKNLAKGKDNTESSNSIVILKPGPMGLQNSETENNFASSLDPDDISHFKSPPARVSSHFSLTEIKKKLKHAMGKERRHGNHRGIPKKLPIECQNMQQDGKVFGKNNVGMKSPNMDHFFIEKIKRPTSDDKKGDKDGKLRDSEVIVDNKSDSYLKQRDSNLYIEAKKHLYEMLGNGDESMEFSSRQIPETLGRILSLPEYNFSPLGSPGRDLEHHFVTAQAGLSDVEKTPEANQNFQATFIGHPDQPKNNPAKQSSICDESSGKKVQEINSGLNLSDDHIHDNKANETCYPVRNEIVPKDNVESIRGINALDFSSESVGLIAIKDQICDDSEVSDGSKPCCLNQDILEENRPLSSPLSSPSQSSASKQIEELESGTDVSGRPSPVSVLDTPFLDDDISPGNTRFEPDKVPIQPLQIQFEDHVSSPMDQIDGGKNYVDENKLVFDYIKAVLQASGLNGDQLWIKYLSSHQILDQSLFDEAEFLPNKLCHDQKLLFDCINEVLVDACWHYFGVSPWVSFVKPSVRPTPDMKKVILKVWEGVCWHLLSLPQPHTLDQIVRKDMARSESWMDLRCDAETVGFEMGEAILEELMEDAVLSCVNERPESETLSHPPLELQNNEESNTNL